MKKRRLDNAFAKFIRAGAERVTPKAFFDVLAERPSLEELLIALRAGPSIKALDAADESLRRRRRLPRRGNCQQRSK